MKNMANISDTIALLVIEKPLKNGIENKNSSEWENGLEHLVLLVLTFWKDVLGLTNWDIMKLLVILAVTLSGMLISSIKEEKQFNKLSTLLLIDLMATHVMKKILLEEPS